MSIEGPCCQSARLATDQADVQKTKIHERMKACLMLFVAEYDIRKIMTAVNAIKKEAMVFSISP